MSSIRPLVSVVTVVFNGEKYLEETIQSVINQTYKNIEYIIIDGGSTDGTLDIIRKYEDKIAYWVSERDRGIYDAMNKGVMASNGDWINFMNAGDRFYSNHTIEDIFATSYLGCDIIFGDLMLDYGSFTRTQKAYDINSLWKGMIFSHQSCFISSELHKKKLYSLDYSIGADFDFFYSSYLEGTKFEYIPKAISIMNTNGLCDTNRLDTISQWSSVVAKYDNTFITALYYKYQYFDQLSRKCIKKILPQSIIRIIQSNRI